MVMKVAVNCKHKVELGISGDLENAQFPALKSMLFQSFMFVESTFKTLQQTWEK